MIAPDPLTTAINELQARPPSASQLSVEGRVRLCRECLNGLLEVAEEWIYAGARAKQCPGQDSVLAEELLSGPAVVARQLQLTMQTLRAIQSGSNPRLPGSIQRLTNGQLTVPVFPTRGFFDSLTFSGLRGHVRLRNDVSENEIHGRRVEIARGETTTGITAVLGAGNVSSIPVSDCLNRILFDRRQVVLKMNPVNQYLFDIFRRALEPLIRANLLRIITGSADVGRQLVHHPSISDVHVTGSVATHEAIVWGDSPEERQRRKQSNAPQLTKPVTSELGNVSPWIIVPGRYSLGQLRSQAQHLAASITNNVSFNCLSTKVIVTWKHWEQRTLFLELINRFLAETPRRPAYYPGAAARYQRFAANGVHADDSHRFPWTLLTNQSIDDRPELFREESFVCVCAETTLDGSSPVNFLEGATEFLNDRVFGSLCASVTFPTVFRRERQADTERCLQNLRYGTVCVNQWSGLAYGLVSPPWGAWPGATLANLDSGIGDVHNIYLLDHFEKTVLQGPLINFPKPVWFPNHKNALKVAKRLFALYDVPSITRLPPLFAAALLG